MGEFGEAERYTYTVRWSKEDEAWVATCLELPDLSWSTCAGAREALFGIIQAAAQVLEDVRRLQRVVGGGS